MDVVGEVSVESVSDILAQAEGWVEDPQVPAPGGPDEVHEDLQSLLWVREVGRREAWGCERSMQRNVPPWRRELLCGGTRNLMARKLPTLPFV